MSRWESAKGRVVSARVPDRVYTLLKKEAEARGLLLGAYLAQLLTHDSQANG